MATFDPNTSNNYLNVKTAAQRIGIAEITLRRIVANRGISFIRLGAGRGRIWFTEQHVSDYLSRRTFPAAA